MNLQSLLGITRVRRTTIYDEIKAIEKKIIKEEIAMDRLSDEFFRDGGVCCPGCGLPGYSERQWAQERRAAWLKILKAKASIRSHI